MRLLLLSWYFPPYNDIGAVRTGRWADYLQNAGHDVWVITGARDHPDQSLSTSLPTDRIIRTGWFDVDRLSPTWPARGSHGKRDSTQALFEISERTKAHVRLSEQYAALIRIPDRQIGWLPRLVRAGKALLEQERIDVIYASGPSFTAFLGASRLSRRFRVPWFAEYRDPWSRDVYRQLPIWRGPIDALLENRTVKTASGVVAVSQPWANQYRERFGKPTIAIYNGFDRSTVDGVGPHIDRSGQVSIVYLGVLYGRLRDPSRLYEAIKRSSLGPGDIRVVYYGPSESDVLPAAKHLGVEAFVTVKSRIGYRESLKAQHEADVLLLLQSPADPGNVPAKFFEYLAARRPILGLGLEEGVPAQLINERRAGLYVSDVDAIADQLKNWVREKRLTGSIKSAPEEALSGLSREEQFGQLTEFLASVLRHQSRTGR